MIDDSRTRLIVGVDGIEKLSRASVAVFGLGGVGGYAAEAIARSGVGTMVIVDFDTVAPSNLNRQIISLMDNIGRLKTDVCEERLRSINPELNIIKHTLKVTENNIDSILMNFTDNLYVIDAIDDIRAKAALMAYLQKNNITFISSMGAGNRLNPCAVTIDDISKTSHCPLARIMRKKLKEYNIYKGITVVYSTEEPLPADRNNSGIKAEERAIGSISFLPGIFGLTAAGYIIKKIIE